MAGSERVVDHCRIVIDSTRSPDALGAYTGARPDVQALVPRSARRILDLGCASGAVGGALRRRQGAEVVGVEIDPGFARQAAARLDRVIEGDLTEALARDDLGRFDCIVAADVLEHLPDPWAALRAAAGLLEPGGTVVVSLPNVRFWETFWELLVHGRWPRRDHGIFDRTHLRWFTLRDARELFAAAGLTVDEVAPQIRVRRGGSRFDRRFSWLGRTPLHGLFAYQYVLNGSREGPAGRS